jgi:hypothetical protein
MNQKICKDCYDGIGPTLRYLRDVIKAYKPDDKRLEPMKQKWLYFLRDDK